MPPKKQRLSRSEYTRVLQRGVRVPARYITLIGAPAQDTKYGVTVSKKTAKNATARHVVRRRIYALCRECAPYPQGKHLVVIARTQANTVTYNTLRDDFLEAMRQLPQ